jgi:UDP-glucose 4-epimerase
VLALEKQIANNYTVYNVWTWKGTSVLEMIHSVEEITWKNIPREKAARREGDIATSVANVDKIYNELWWSAAYSITDAVKHAVAFRTLV